MTGMSRDFSLSHTILELNDMFSQHVQWFEQLKTGSDVT